MTNKTRWGIIGIGNIAIKFAKDLKNVESAELVAVASNSLERAKVFANDFNVSNAYGNYEEIFQTELDAIYIATPHTDHARCTLMCLENKVGVLCEKPFAMNLPEVEQMIASAKENKTFLMEALWTRFLPSTLKMLEIINAGTIGDIKTLHADFGFVAPFVPDRRVWNPKLGGGAFLDIGIYPAFMSLLVLGYPVEIKATAVKGQTGVDETTTFLYKYENGSTASLNCTFTAQTRTDALIYGTKGYIHIPTRFHEATELFLHLEDGTVEHFEFPRETFGYDFEAEEVGKCLAKGLLQSDIWTWENSLSLIRLLDSTRKEADISYPHDEQ